MRSYRNRKRLSKAMQDDMPEIDGIDMSSKERFEAWWYKHKLESWMDYPDAKEENLPEFWGESYKKDALEAWQACEDSFVVELPIPVHRMNFNYGKGYIDCLNKDDVIKAIEKVGGIVK